MTLEKSLHVNHYCLSFNQQFLKIIHKCLFCKKWMFFNCTSLRCPLKINTEIPVYSHWVEIKMCILKLQINTIVTQQQQQRTWKHHVCSCADCRYQRCSHRDWWVLSGALAASTLFSQTDKRVGGRGRSQPPVTEPQGLFGIYTLANLPPLLGKHQQPASETLCRISRLETGYFWFTLLPVSSSGNE